MSHLISDLDIETALPGAPFSEYHRRVVDRPIDDVWPACLAVTVAEVRTLAPLMALRGLPRLLTRRAPEEGPMAGGTPLLETFEGSGFVILRRDEQPVGGRASVMFGAVGRFWSVSHNMPVPIETPAELLAFDEPGFAKTVARLDAVDLGDGRTRIETETRAAGTDAASTRRFAPYWAVIRLPSGLIRRSWLAGVGRRAGAGR
ncbi:MAG: hypothetical protein AAF480_02665 [Actinomycetota bacterium]